MAAINFLKICVKKILIFLIRIYQNFISQLLGNYKCRFNPSCSEYMIEAIEKKGLITGLFLGTKRILSCHPFSKKNGFDPVK